MKKLIQKIKKFLLISSDGSSIPIQVQIIARFFYVLYDIEDNESVGEIRKFNFVESQKNTHEIGKRVVSSEYVGDQYYDFIWIHVGHDYFKCILKCKYYGIT
jgi:hypothetical protein